VKINKHVNWSTVVDFGNTDANDKLMDNVILGLSYEDSHCPFLLIFSGRDYYEIISEKKLHRDRWYHLVAVWDGENGKIFVNGYEKELSRIEGKHASPRKVVRNKCLIGKANFKDDMSGTYAIANACFDEIRIYRGALKRPDISALFLTS
jgi:hypothetical protein